MSKACITIIVFWIWIFALTLRGWLLSQPECVLGILIVWPCRFWIPFASPRCKHAFYGLVLLSFITLFLATSLRWEKEARFLAVVVFPWISGSILTALAWSDALTLRQAQRNREGR
jgi:hypothetical protein